MKYTPREIKENVNVSKKSPLKEVLLLLGGLLGILFGIYVILGFAVDFVAPRLPPGVEKQLGKMYGDPFRNKEVTPAEKSLQEILDRLVELSDMNDRHFVVHILPFSKANAFAFPGDRIVVTSELLRQADSENELAFILAHELGHFAGKDHLRGLGRGLVLTVISAVLFGDNSSISRAFMQSMMDIEMKYSRNQEKSADLFALDLLFQRYGHVGGATAFFEKMSSSEQRSRIFYFFATHPFPEDRVDNIRKTTVEKGYPINPTLPIPEIFKKIPRTNMKTPLKIFGGSARGSFF